MTKKKQTRKRGTGAPRARARKSTARVPERKLAARAAGRLAVDAAPIAPLAPTRRDRVLFAVTLGLAFLAPFVFYLFTLAPTVTLEDSGELIAAAYNWGIPHEPGYPLFTMLAKLFTLLPFGDIAWRVNLMSAVLSSLGCLFVAWATLLLVDELRFGRRVSGGGEAAVPGSPLRASAARPEAGASLADHRRLLFPSLSGLPGLLVCVSGLSAALFAGTARSVWEQSVITEVYGLNSAFVGLLLVLALAWGRARRRRPRVRVFYAICFTFGLALTNHTTIVLLLPAFVLYGLIVELHAVTLVRRALRARRTFLRSLKPRLRPRLVQAGVGFALFAAGLLPYLYLPIASSRDPVLDWGNPETWTNFWRTVSRRQYVTELQSSLGGFFAQLGWYGELLERQWLPVVVLALAALGLALLLRRRSRPAWFVLFFLLLTGPLTTYATNFPVDVQPQLLADDNKALVSVFYLPSYLGVALLAGLAVWWLCDLLAARLRWKPAIVAVAAVIAVALPVGSAARIFPRVDMSDYRFAEAYIHNVDAVTTPGALVMGNRDQFVFPLMYSNMVLKDHPDVMYVDQELLRRSWYLQMLRDHYPQAMAAIAPQTDAFLAAVAPFEANEPYSSDELQRTYVAMVDGLIAAFIDHGRQVYLTYQPEPDIAADYRAEALPSAYRPVRPRKAFQITNAPLSSFDFAHLTDGTVLLDRNVDFLRDFYGTVLQIRAEMFSRLKRDDEAAQLNALAEQLLQAE